VTELPGPRAAQRYKDVVADLAAAVDALRERDRLRATELARELVDLDDAMVRAGERAALSQFGAEMAWEEALDMLWQESWMTLRLRPVPAPSMDPTRLNELDRAVEDAAAELREAVRRRFWQR
jgi:hypothetical protein